jgi:hypothetical protein
MERAEVTDKAKGKAGLVPAPEPLKPSLLCCFRILWLLDICALGAALYLGYWLRVGSGLFGPSLQPGAAHLVVLAVVSVGWTAIFASQGL